MKNNRHYMAIADYYGARHAERSGVLLINHIEEGLRVLAHIKASVTAMEAFCIHPLLQDDPALIASLQRGSLLSRFAVKAEALVMAMEYRAVANAYLSHHFKDRHDNVSLSCLPDVNLMLIADKVQNRKDFERYHLATHPQSAILQGYFSNWLRRLDVTEEQYAAMCEIMFPNSGDQTILSSLN